MIYTKYFAKKFDSNFLQIFFHNKIYKYFLGLNTFLVLIFVVFVADGPHFDIMFKMVIILTECLE